MSDINLPPLSGERTGKGSWSAEETRDYARAAVLADRAARVAVEWPGSYDAKGNPLGPHDNNDEVTVPHMMLSPTHFCKDCGAYWRQCDDFTFNLRSPKACEACNNAPVGGQLIELSRVARAARALADEAQEYDMDFGLGCAAPNSYWEDLWNALDPDPLDERPCTCHPDDNPPVPCPQKYALSECRAAVLADRLYAAPAGASTTPAEPVARVETLGNGVAYGVLLRPLDDGALLFAAPVRDEAWIAAAMRLADEYAYAFTLVPNAARATLFAHLKGAR